MAPKHTWRIRFKRWGWIAGAMAVAVLLVQAFRRAEPEPPSLALHSVPFTIPPGELPWPDRWLMRGPSWKWLRTLRTKIWPRNPSAKLTYGFWDLRRIKPLRALPSIATQTNEDWVIHALSPDQVALAEAELQAVGIGGTQIGMVSGEGIQTTLTTALPMDDCRIEAAVRIREEGIHVTSAVALSPTSKPLVSTQQVEVALEAMVPDHGAVLLLSRRADPPRAIWVKATKKP
jgi:hypothetical protein